MRAIALSAALMIAGAIAAAPLAPAEAAAPAGGKKVKAAAGHASAKSKPDGPLEATPCCSVPRNPNQR